MVTCMGPRCFLQFLLFVCMGLIQGRALEWPHSSNWCPVLDKRNRNNVLAPPPQKPSRETSHEPKTRSPIQHRCSKVCRGLYLQVSMTKTDQDPIRHDAKI